MTCGIYEIVNTVTGKRYVGSSVDVSRRWASHRHALRNGCGRNAKLQNSWNKYGEESFLFNVIEVCDPENLIDREQYYIDEKSELNIRTVADSNRGRVVSKEERLIRSSAMVDRHAKSPELRVATAELFARLRMDAGYNEMVSNSISDAQKEAWSRPEAKKNRLAKRNTDSYRAKVSIATSGVNNPMYDDTIYEFISPAGGIVLSTKIQLYTKFNLDKSHITKLCLGRSMSHKGWRIKKAPEGA